MKKVERLIQTNLAQDFNQFSSKIEFVPNKINIILPLVRNETSLATLSRVAALALEHYKIVSTYSSAKLNYIADTGINQFETDDHRSFQKAIKQSNSLEFSDLRNYISELINPEIFNIVYFPDGILTKKNFSILHKEFFLDQENIFFQHPNKKWSVNIDQNLINQFLNVEDLNQFFEFVVYLASSDDGELVFLEEAILKQKNNLKWFLRSLKQRLEVIEFNTEKLETSIRALNTGERELLLYQHLCSEFLKQLHMKGDVREFNLYLRRYLDLFNAFFNAPTFRHRLEESQLSPTDFQIIAGAKQQIGIIIELLFIFSKSNGLSLES